MAERIIIQVQDNQPIALEAAMILAPGETVLARRVVEPAPTRYGIPAWSLGLAVVPGVVYVHDDLLWRCVQGHTTQSDWQPGAEGTGALWVRVWEDEWPEWVQPTGAHDAYNTGDKVTFQGGRYISAIDNNVWSPVAYPQGWEYKGPAI